MTSPDRESSHVPWQITFKRFVCAPLFQFLFVYNIANEHGQKQYPEGLRRAKKLVKDGYGLIIAITHISEKDGLALYNLAIGQTIFCSREIEGPMAKHQYDDHKEVVDTMQDHFGVIVHPLTTPHTIEQIGYNTEDLGKEIIPCARACARVLKKGGIVPIALQARREDVIGEPNDSLPILMMVANRVVPYQKYAVLFAGLEYKGVKDYSEVHEIFINKRDILTRNNCLTVRIGNCFTAQEIMGEITSYAQFNNIELNRDSTAELIATFGNDQLAYASPQAYTRGYQPIFT